MTLDDRLDDPLAVALAELRRAVELAKALIAGGADCRARLDQLEQRLEQHLEKSAGHQ